MQPTSLLSLSLAVVLASGFSMASHSETAPAKRKAVMNEAYFSTDVDEAVLAAKRNPINNNYVGARWHNRSTVKSFALPKLMNAEMDEQVIEGAMGPTAAGEAAAAETQLPAKDSAMGRKDQDSLLQDTQNVAVSSPSATAQKRVDNPQSVYIREANTSTTTLGSSSVTNIRGLSTSNVSLR